MYTRSCCQLFAPCKNGTNDKYTHADRTRHSETMLKIPYNGGANYFGATHFFSFDCCRCRSCRSRSRIVAIVILLSCSFVIVSCSSIYMCVYMYMNMVGICVTIRLILIQSVWCSFSFSTYTISRFSTNFGLIEMTCFLCISFAVGLFFISFQLNKKRKFTRSDCSSLHLCSFYSKCFFYRVSFFILFRLVWYWYVGLRMIISVVVSCLSLFFCTSLFLARSLSTLCSPSVISSRCPLCQLFLELILCHLE